MKAVSFGAIIWDIIDGKKYLGGAPFNLAAHLAKLGAESYIISRIGKDALGEEALKVAAGLGVDISLVQLDTIHSTGTVKVSLTGDGQPSYIIDEDVAYDYIQVNDRLVARIKDIGIEAFSFGTLEQRSELTRNTLYFILDSLKIEYVLYDVNLRQNYYSKETVQKSLSYANLLKLNSEELAQLSDLIYNKKLSEKQFFSQLDKDYSLKSICVTKGENGCSVYSAGKIKEVLGNRVKVLDTVCDGAAFSAVFLYKYYQTGEPYQAAELANCIGGYVASCRGAIPEYSEEIKSLIKRQYS